MCQELSFILSSLILQQLYAHFGVRKWNLMYSNIQLLSQGHINTKQKVSIYFQMSINSVLFPLQLEESETTEIAY
jgi:hypothetical protein